MVAGFRPARLIGFSSNVQTMVICMLDSVPALLNVVLLGCCIFFVFAVMGLQLFMVCQHLCHVSLTAPNGTAGNGVYLHRYERN